MADHRPSGPAKQEGDKFPIQVLLVILLPVVVPGGEGEAKEGESGVAGRRPVGGAAARGVARLGGERMPGISGSFPRVASFCPPVVDAVVGENAADGVGEG